jgi:hypothetical protein
MVRSRGIGLLVIGLVVAVAGCGTPRRTITGAEAIDRLTGYLKEAVDAAPPGIHLTRVKAEATNGDACVKALSDSDFTGQVEAEVDYQASGVSASLAGQYLDALGRLWKDKWGKVDAVRDHVGVDIDKARFTLYGNYWGPQSGVLDVSGHSSCIWANGTPGPDDNP